MIIPHYKFNNPNSISIQNTFHFGAIVFLHNFSERSFFNPAGFDKKNCYNNFLIFILFKITKLAPFAGEKNRTIQIMSEKKLLWFIWSMVYCLVFRKDNRWRQRYLEKRVSEIVRIMIELMNIMKVILYLLTRFKWTLH